MLKRIFDSNKYLLRKDLTTITVFV
ncbi:hypothetical protein DSM3645_18021 [Blastopirellula marina DSM 3645]|uniref:Uncharacterized protein n=1 Tax=Blastopirellula marina DSM 3645 TaxID=314230 RepID=A3ZYN9_9BACT|nr:hypothetical protein DSM3645_18021 [Blastopirellula marina DSM 3645]